MVEKTGEPKEKEVSTIYFTNICKVYKALTELAK